MNWEQIVGQEKLKKAKVLVIGAGGLGCPILQYIATAGVGYIGIMDFDTIEIHNLHRQILYTESEIGKEKSIIAKEVVSQIKEKVNNYVKEHIDREINKFQEKRLEIIRSNESNSKFQDAISNLDSELIDFIELINR